MRGHAPLPPACKRINIQQPQAGKPLVVAECLSQCLMSRDQHRRLAGKTRRTHRTLLADRLKLPVKAFTFKQINRKVGQHVKRAPS